MTRGREITREYDGVKQHTRARFFSYLACSKHAALSLSLPSMVTGVSRGVIDSLSGRRSYIVKRTRVLRNGGTRTEAIQSIKTCARELAGRRRDSATVLGSFLINWREMYSGLTGAYRTRVLDVSDLPQACSPTVDLGGYISDDNKHLIAEEFANREKLRERLGTAI